MCRTMTRYGSDKGSGWHYIRERGPEYPAAQGECPGPNNYTTVYSTLFRGWHDRPLRILELGLGALTRSMRAHESMSPQAGSLHEAAASSGLSSSPELSCPRDHGSFRRPAHRRHHPGHCGLLERAATLY